MRTQPRRGPLFLWGGEGRGGAEPRLRSGTDRVEHDGAEPSRASSPAAPAAPDTAAATARAQLAALPVKGKAAGTGYDRVGQFGTAWLDVDHNGCDTRNDVLARDLTAIERQGPCKVLRGTLVSPYTGATIDFVRGNTTRRSCRSTTWSRSRTPGGPARSSSRRTNARRWRTTR